MKTVKTFNMALTRQRLVPIRRSGGDHSWNLQHWPSEESLTPAPSPRNHSHRDSKTTDGVNEDVLDQQSSSNDQDFYFMTAYMNKDLLNHSCLPSITSAQGNPSKYPPTNDKEAFNGTELLRNNPDRDAALANVIFTTRTDPQPHKLKKLRKQRGKRRVSYQDDSSAGSYIHIVEPELHTHCLYSDRVPGIAERDRSMKNSFRLQEKVVKPVMTLSMNEIETKHSYEPPIKRKSRLQKKVSFAQFPVTKRRPKLFKPRFGSKMEEVEALFLTSQIRLRHVPRKFLKVTNTDPFAPFATSKKSSKSIHALRSRKPSLHPEKPLVKFRRVVKMVLILLKATYSDREGGQRRERYLSLWASVLGGKFSNSRRAYEMYGISFDPQEFKANTEVQVSTEAKAILSLEPSQRSPQQLRQVLASLRQAVDEFSEFPITMQESLARVGRYEHFEAKRVIIRQGHLAENFYFILSGTAVVIIMDTDKHTSEQTARTAAFLGKGKSFGELALMHQSRRTATVTCQEDVELLSVSREDFLHIFMHTVERDAEPEHVRFLRSLHILRDWPVEVLPTDNPLVLVFHYVRRGIVLCKDSNTSEWLFVIKSGSCRVIKALKEVRAQGTTPRLRAMPNAAKHKKHGDESKHGKTSIEPSETSDSMTFPLLPPLSPVQSDTKNSRRHYSRKQILPGLDVSAEKLERVSQEHFQVLNSIHRRFHIPVDQNSPESSRSSSSDGESQSNMQDRPLSDGYHNNAQSTVFVEVQTLQPGDIHGLEPCVFRSMGTPTSTSLVSCGAELIMINRKFFMDNTSEQMRKRIRREIRPLPSEETLQSQLQTKISWKAYTQHTLSTTLQLQRKQAARHACPMIQS